MSSKVVGIQPAVLRWARERAGQSLEDIATAMGKDVATIEAWESGQEAPTYVQLEKLAYQFYKRPIAVFFFPEPPPEADLKKSFRTLPDFEIDSLATDTRYALRYAQAMQLALRELNDSINPAAKKIFDELRLQPGANIGQVAAQVRTYLGVPLEEQVEWKSSEDALKAWRAKVQEAGVFVFKRSFKQKDISGFCLLDDQFPIIYLNNGDPATRQSFSLFHELAHILFHVNGITKQNDRYIEYLPNTERRIEELCNRFAGEFLVPSPDFEKQIHGVRPDDATMVSLAKRYNVSRVVILRKFLDRGLVDRAYYEAKAEQWLNEYLEAKAKSESGGGSYYRTQAAYLGEKYLGLVFGKYYQGRLSAEQVADYLGVKTKSIAGLEHVFMSKAAPA